jgi:hypothetical protein
MGWLASFPAFLLFSFFLSGDFRAGVLPWMLTLAVVMLANILFVQLPKKLILRTISRSSHFTFTVISAAYAVLAFTLLIGWVYADQPGTYLLLSGCAVVIGSTAGFVFYKTYCKTSA